MKKIKLKVYLGNKKMKIVTKESYQRKYINTEE